MQTQMLARLFALCSRYTQHDRELDEALDAAVKALTTPEVVYLVWRRTGGYEETVEGVQDVCGTLEEARACWEEERRALGPLAIRLDNGELVGRSPGRVWVERRVVGRGGAVEEVLGNVPVSWVEGRLYLITIPGQGRVGDLVVAHRKGEVHVSEYPTVVDRNPGHQLVPMAAATRERLVELAGEVLRQRRPGALLNVVERQEET